MSLVHEALRKAEREKQRKLGVAANAPAASQTTTPQPIHTLPVHPPAVAQTVTSIARETATHKPVPSVVESTEANHFLLPALIGCVAIVAIIAIVFLASNASSVLRQSRETAPVTTVAATAPVATPTIAPVAPMPPAQPTAGSTAMADVSSPPVAAPASDESKYNLTGIMKDPDGKPIALLNGHMVYEGSDFDGGTVDKIESDRVTINAKGQNIVLRLR
jgi:hypothetical protein